MPLSGLPANVGFESGRLGLHFVRMLLKPPRSRVVPKVNGKAAGASQRHHHMFQARFR